MTGTLQRALSFDSNSNSHPVVQDVSTPTEIKQMFDAVIYNKVCTLEVRLLAPTALNHFVSRSC